jgi:jumonji domain-containing protein 2
MCWFKLRDGIAKVSLPAGFWAKTDLTGRGRHWAKGSKLGDTLIPSPIKQALSGIGGVYEYTLLEQPPIAVAQFRSLSDEYRLRHVGREYDEDQSDEFCDDLARKFWRRLGPTMEPAMYGADMEGTLFKDAQACGWNVDRLESCLCLLRADAQDERDDEVFRLPGVTSAYLYFGMWASAFAAHAEDMNLLSINYLHAGSPKYWYAIAQEDSKRFESLARSHFPGQASECHEFLRHKRCLLSPAILKKAGIKFTTCVQRPGDAIITFPGSYHFGFNTGFNIAESTNFAVPEWIPLGEAADVCMCHPHSVRINMRRLKTLLESYEKDMCYRESIGLPKLTYTNWAKHEARRLKRLTRACASQKVLVCDGVSLLKLPTAYNASIPIEVTKESRKKTRKSLTRQKYSEWRLAKRVRPALFIPNTQVICLVECIESHVDGHDGHEFFVGSVVKIIDSYVKIHLTGLGKKDDLWFEQDSDHLFLDGGPIDPPSPGTGRDRDSANHNSKAPRCSQDRPRKRRIS